jgi:hypothetical protein
MSIAESRPLIAMTLQALMNRSILDNQGIDLIAIARLTLVRRPVVALGAPRVLSMPQSPRHRTARRPVAHSVRNRSLVDVAVDVTHGPLYHRRVLNDRRRAKEKTE